MSTSLTYSGEFDYTAHTTPSIFSRSDSFSKYLDESDREVTYVDDSPRTHRFSDITESTTDEEPGRLKEIWNSVKSFFKACFDGFVAFVFPCVHVETPEKFENVHKVSSSHLNSRVCSNEREVIEPSMDYYRDDVPNIPELSRELLVSEEKLLAKLDEGSDIFESYITRKRAKYGEVMERARSEYEQVFTNYEVDEESRDQGQLRAKGAGHVAQGLTKDLLMKIVRHSVLQLANLQDDDQQGVEIHMKKYSDWHLLAKRENGSLHIAKWGGDVELEEWDRGYLGRGSFGIVHKVEDVANGCFAAFKFALPRDSDYQAKAEGDVYSESVKLREFHSGGQKDGLQAAPHAFFKITGRPSGERVVGYMQKLYNCGDLIEALNKGELSPSGMTKRQGLLMMRQLFTGLKTLHTETPERGATIHGDIKADNIFVDKVRDGQYSFAIADLGDAKNTKTEMTLEKKSELLNLPLGTIASIGYFTEGDWNSLNIALNSNDHAEWIKLQKKRDIYATSASIWMALTGKSPYTVPDEKIFPRIGTDKPAGFSSFRSKYGREVADMLDRTLAEDPTMRPTVDQILAAIDEGLGGGMCTIL